MIITGSVKDYFLHQGTILRNADGTIKGRGFTRASLEQQGYSKKTLRQLVSEGTLVEDRVVDAKVGRDGKPKKTGGTHHVFFYLPCEE